MANGYSSLIGITAAHVVGHTSHLTGAPALRHGDDGALMLLRDDACLRYAIHGIVLRQASVIVTLS